MSNGNGFKWFAGTMQIFVAGLLVAAAGGAIWSAIEVRSLSVKFDAMTSRVERIDTRVERNSARLRGVETQ